MKIKNWKTALAGLLGGVVVAGPQVIHCITAQTCDYKQLAFGVAFTLLGLGAKDKDVTGGTRPQ